MTEVDNARSRLRTWEKSRRESRLAKLEGLAPDVRLVLDALERAEAVVPEVVCPTDGTVIRARLADQPGALRDRAEGAAHMAEADGRARATRDVLEAARAVVGNARAVGFRGAAIGLDALVRAVGRLDRR